MVDLNLTGGYAGFLGIFTAVSAVVLVAWLIGKVGVKLPFISQLAGTVSKIPGKFVMVFVVGGLLLWGLPLLGLGVVPKNLSIGGGGLTTTSLDSAVQVTDGCVRNPNAPTQNYLAAVENKDNPADAFLGYSLDFVADDMKTVYNTGTANTGTTLSYVTTTVPHCVQGYIIGTNNATFKKAFAADQPQKQEVIDGSLRSTTTFFALNFDTGANITAAGTPATSGAVSGAFMGNGSGVAAQTIIVQNYTLASGGSQNVKFQIALATANAQYGAYNAADGVIMGAYISDLTAFSASKGVVISSIDNGASATEIQCPSDIAANRRANKCWKLPTLKSDRTYTVTGTVNADLGNPGVDDYMDIYLDDVQYYKDTDGNYKYGAFAADGTNIGATGGQMRWLFN